MAFFYTFRQCLLTITVRGYQISNAYCLFFFIGIVSLRNMPMHYAMGFKGCKNDNFFKIKIVIFFLFLLKTQIVGTRYNRINVAVLTSTHNLYFRTNIRCIIYTLVYPSFIICTCKWFARESSLHGYLSMVLQHLK